MAEPIPTSAARLRWFVGGVFLGLLAEQTVLFAVPLMIYQNTRSISYSGGAFALEWLPAILAYPFAGMLADRLGGRHLFLKANLARTVCLSLTLFFCWLAPSLAIWGLIVNGVFLSVLIAPIRMAIEKTVPLLARGGDLPRIQSVVQNVELLAMALGPALAAGLAQLLGKLPLLGVAAAAFLLAAYCWRALPSIHRPTGSVGRIGQDLLLGWRLLLGNRPVVLLALVNFSINLAFAVALSANAYVITDTFGASDSVFGLMSAGAGALGLLNLFLIPRLLRKWTVYHLGAWGFSMLCLGLACMGLATGVWFYVAAFLLGMAGVAMFNVFNRTQRVKAIPPDHLGKVIGPFYLVNSLSYPLGGVLTATLGHTVGIQQIVLFLALMLAGPGATLLWLTSRHFRAALDTPLAPQKTTP